MKKWTPKSAKKAMATSTTPTESDRERNSQRGMTGCGAAASRATKPASRMPAAGRKTSV
jgi:hypothetical protein